MSLFFLSLFSLFVDGLFAEIFNVFSLNILSVFAFDVDFGFVFIFEFELKFSLKSSSSFILKGADLLRFLIAIDSDIEDGLAISFRLFPILCFLIDITTRERKNMIYT